VALGDSGNRGVWTRKAAGCKRVPWNKGDTSFGANVDEPVGGSIPEIVAVLDGNDWGHGARSGELPLRDVRHADMPDLPLPLEVDKRADRILDRYPIIDRM